MQFWVVIENMRSRLSYKNIISTNLDNESAKVLFQHDLSMQSSDLIDHEGC